MSKICVANENLALITRHLEVFTESGPTNEFIVQNSRNIQSTTRTEAELISTLHNSIRGNQYFGNFSINMSPQKLSHKFLSCQYFLCGFLLIMELLIIIGYGTTAFHETQQSLQIQRATERISTNVTYALTILYSIGTRIYGLVRCKETLKCWGDFCLKVDQLKDVGQILSSLRILAVEKNVRRHVYLLYGATLGFVILLTTGFTTAYFPSKEDILSGKRTWFNYAIHFTVTVVFSLAFCGNLMYISWIVSPTKVINGIFLELKDSLENMGIQNCEQRIQDWVENYRKAVPILKTYENHFGPGLILAVAYTAIQITCETYSVIWLVGLRSFFPSVTRMAKLALSLNALFELANNAGKLEGIQTLLYHELCRIETWLPGGDYGYKRQEVSALLKQMVMEPLKITPGGFFTLSRTLITSIISASSTFVIVLLQFRGAE
ncbi:uncharacterized protein LOC118435881 [Folsomia candida]|uniref:uncharacterized protein LOC118435881 n=1 Tax=Folsomia candida TaxID=158441 RepID=UPI001604E72C|nr:uncharacterized protein LOC118435881 [Folsomia candida]